MITSTPSSIIGLYIYVPYPAIPFHAPALNRVVVIGRVDATDLHQVLTCWLGVAGLIDTSALQDGFLAGPSPREAESRVAFRQHRLLELRAVPRASTVHTHLNLGDSSSTAPREAADLLKAGVSLRPGKLIAYFDKENEYERIRTEAGLIASCNRSFHRRKHFVTCPQVRASLALGSV